MFLGRRAFLQLSSALVSSPSPSLHQRPLWFSTPAASPHRFAALWGNGDYGRLGLGSLESKWTPTVCPFFAHDEPPVSVACGGAHTLFLTESRRVYAVGLNNYGQLGTSPAKSHSLIDSSACSQRKVVGMTTINMGEPVEVVGLPEKVAQISAGYYHSSAISDDGELFVWGNNANGQLGLGKRAESVVPTPTKIECLSGISISMVALGAEHSVALTDKGNVLSWGAGGSGRLGHGHQSSILGFSLNSSEYTPRLIKYFEGVKVKRVAAGMLHSACITEEGTLYVFGERTSAKLGFGGLKSISTPSAVQELPFSEEVACGGYHTCVLTSGGSLCTWGSNENGCLGLGCTDMIRSPESVKSSLFKFPISEVSCGWKHTAAISGGKVFTWGWGGANGTFSEDGHSSGGQLGHGSDVDYFEPMVVNVDRNVKALHISCGFNHTAGIFEYTES